MNFGFFYPKKLFEDFLFHMCGFFLVPHYATPAALLPSSCLASGLSLFIFSLYLKYCTTSVGCFPSHVKTLSTFCTLHFTHHVLINCSSKRRFYRDCASTLHKPLLTSNVYSLSSGNIDLLTSYCEFTVSLSALPDHILYY